MTDAPPEDKSPQEKSPQDKSPQAAPTSGEDAKGERIAKRLARAGLCSRREAEAWIAAGRVVVNGEVLASPATNVSTRDDIRVDGKPLPEPEPMRLWRYHKPTGLLTTHKDPQGRPTVFAALPPTLPRVISVGRLDFNSEGLLLLTTDGALAQKLERPATGWVRRYRVRVHGSVDPKRLAHLADGHEVSGIRYGPIEASIDREGPHNSWLSLSLREGKNREVRKVMESLGLEVTRLIRVSYGPFQLGNLARGAVEEVKAHVLKDQLGIARTPGARKRPAAKGKPVRSPKQSGPSNQPKPPKGPKHKTSRG